MFRLTLLLAICTGLEGVTIEYPTSAHIEERTRTDIDAILLPYLTAREIQFHANALTDGLPYFLRCQGSKDAMQFTVPPSATKFLSLDTDRNAKAVTAKLRRNELTADLVGRYTCSEMVGERKQETSVYVFIEDGRTVFTKEVYPTAFKETGIHFFNLPCQTTSWYPRMTCPTVSDGTKCSVRQCSARERQTNELKCNTPVCEGQELCIPVSFAPADLKAQRVLFDPQIGFALESPVVHDSVTYFSCKSSYTPRQQSKVPYEAIEPDYVKIHQPSFSIMSDETVRLSCEIQYSTRAVMKNPSLFWFDDIHQLTLVSNQTDPSVFSRVTQIYSRNSSITLRGFKPNKVYRFYCVRVSEQGLYSRSVDVTCADAPSLELGALLSGLDDNASAPYGSNVVYDIDIFTIPRSGIVVEISRDGVSLMNDPRFELILSETKESQFYVYTLTINNIIFEDEKELQITAKSSAMEKTITVKPKISGDPVGQLAFAPAQNTEVPSWRSDDPRNKTNIHAFGIFEREAYRPVCTIRHSANIARPLKVSIYYVQCDLESCLSNLIDTSCQQSFTQQLLSATSKRESDYQTNFVSSSTHTLTDPAFAYRYLCCYEQDGVTTIAKGLTALANNRQMFKVNSPPFSLVTGDNLTLHCEGHDLIYDDLRMTYNDKLFTYERNRFDSSWRIKGTNQVKEIDLSWNTPASDRVHSTAIEIKTPPLRVIGDNGYLQCVGLSKRPDVIPNANETYLIHVDDPVPLRFKSNLPAVSRLDRKAGENVQFDCTFTGRPKPKLIWLKGKLPLKNDDSTMEFNDYNGTISIKRAQPGDTGYYTCQLNNNRDPSLQRSFDLRVKGAPPSKFSRLVAVIVMAIVILLLLMIILLIIFIVKYTRMKRRVHESIFHKLNETDPGSENFATKPQIRTLLSYVNHETLPPTKDDFKELGRGQFGVVYQVRLPEVGLVAAKMLPESIRRTERRRDERQKGHDIEESKEMLSNDELQKKKAAEMLIDEIKVMRKAGKHVNIIALKKVAYPETKVKFLFVGGPIHDEDSFYLMELCANGSLESVLKSFNRPAGGREKWSLYQTLSSRPDQELTVEEARDQCQLTADDLKLIAYQVAYGIDYLNRRQIAHCDIACRNVLVTTRFIMKICDFGLATSTTYKDYREQMSQGVSVQLDKKTNEIATHNLTPELARSFLRASTSADRSAMHKLSIKSDVWSFGIFLWTLFLKCRLRPFSKLLDEMNNRSDGESFFHRLARVISDGHVLRYIDYQSDIPRDIYALIRDCLVEENDRPEMTRICALLCHSKMLSKQAFEYYRSEYNRYQEENATNDDIERFGGHQGFIDLPTFDSDDDNDGSDPRRNLPRDHDVTFRPTTANPDVHHAHDSYLAPTYDNNIAGRPAAPSTEKPNSRDDSYL